MHFGAVLFDLDGTLVDSERESAEAMARALAKSLDIDITKADREFVIGHSWTEIHANLQQNYGDRLPWDMHELISKSAAHRVDVIAEQGLTILPGAVDAVRRLGPPRALVTGSSRVEATHALHILGVTDAFPVVLAAEDYPRGKPAPDGYLKAASALEVAPKDCVVFEDSTAGIGSGVAAGMTVVAIRAGNFGGQDQSAAHVVVDSFADITDEFLSKLAERA